MEEKNNMLSAEELEKVVGGADIKDFPYDAVFTTRVKSGFLALRNTPANSADNIIGYLWNSSKVKIAGGIVGDYIAVTVLYNAPGDYGGDAAGKYGYVNLNYLEK